MPLSELPGRRVLLRRIVADDFTAWAEVRRRNRDWLLKWEPRPPVTQSDDTESRAAFVARCNAREREWRLGVGYGFGIFLNPPPDAFGRGAEGGPPRFCGELNLSGVQRGPFQNAYVGYWMDEAHAGNGYVPESFVVVARFAFEELHLHRLQVAVIPRNKPSRRVAEKLGLRDEGVAVRYLQINGVWEDHIRYALTAEEWEERREKLLDEWVR